jgi:hypothetical protein
MKDAYSDDLSDFIRNGKLDGYELTDEELAHFLEVWRWAIWSRRNEPSGPDHDIIDATQRLQSHMAQDYQVEVDYNTLLLLRQELEPLMYLRVLRDFPRALGYFLRPRNLLALFRSIVRVRRYACIEGVNDWRTGRRGYPRRTLDALHETAPDLVQRKYWRRVGVSSFEPRKKPYFWW